MDLVTILCVLVLLAGMESGNSMWKSVIGIRGGVGVDEVDVWDKGDTEGRLGELDKGDIGGMVGFLGLGID